MTKLRRFLVIGLCIIMLGTTCIPVSANYTILKKIQGDGVRLRTQPANGTILGLMYNGELVLQNSENIHLQHDWCNIKRSVANGGASGWTEKTYVKDR